MAGLGQSTQTAGASSTQNVNLTQVNGSAISLGQAVMASSVPVTIASNQSGIAVTGTFWQATQPVSGTFWQATQPVSGTVTANAGTGTFNIQSNASVNVAQINGVTPLMGNGVTGTGSQRVTIASDQTAFSVNATLAAETTKVIGTVNIASGQTVGIAAGTAEIGNVKNSGTFAVQAALNAETTKVIGTVNQGTSPWIVAGGGTAGTAASGVVTVQGIASMTKLLVTPDSVALPANQSVNVSQINGVTPLMGNGTTGTGSQRVTVASDNTPFPIKIDQTTPGSTNAVTPVPASNSGWSFSYQSALSSTKVQLKGTAGTFGGYINLFNPNTATTFIQVFNLASASVTVGTTTPDFVITLPGMATAAGTGSDRNFEMVHGVAMSTGITVAATTTSSGSTAPSSAIVATFLYK